MSSDSILAQAIAEQATPLAGGPSDFDPLLDRIGDARFVLLGEATHGTHEFYRIRAELTKRLIRDKGFTAVAAEADWPDARAALGGFRRFPSWMWRNADVLDFAGWLRAHNEQAGAAGQVGFYGLDV